MTNEIATTQQTRSVLIDMAARYGMEAAAFEETVRATAMRPDARGNIPSKAEFAAFLLVAKEYKLNPLLKEIYAFPAQRGGIVPVVSIDGWVNLVNSNPNNDGFDFTFDHDANGNLVSCTCTMHRKDRTRPVVVTEFLSECIRNTDPWKMKHRMLRHKALIQAARYAFGFSGIYDQDEAEKIAEMKDVTPATRGGPPAPKGDAAPAATDAEFEEVRPAAAETKPPKPSAAPAPKAAEPKPEPAVQKEPYDEQAQAEASRREEIESAGQVYDGGEAEDRGGYDDGGTADPIDAGDVEDAEIEEEINDDLETNAPSLDSLIADLKALVSKNLPLAAYFSEMNSIAQKTATWDDFKALYAHRLPHNGDNAIKTGHVTITNAQKARLQPEAGPAASGAQTGTADVTGLNKDIKGNVLWNGPTAYRSEMLSRIEAARAAWEAKKKPEMEQAIYDLADDIALKQESKVLGDAIAKELKGILEAIVEQF